MKETTKISLSNHAMSDQAKQDSTVSKSLSNGVLYRSLDMGEIILEGDEGSPDKKTWVKITRDDPWGWVIGMTVCMMVPNIRREI